MSYSLDTGLKFIDVLIIIILFIYLFIFLWLSICVLFSISESRQSVADRVSQLRKQVCGVFNLDILSLASLDQTGAPKQYDVITSGFCLEAVATTKETYLECAKNVRSLLKPGGFFVHIGELNNDSSEIDDLSFTGINLNSEDVKEAYVKADFCIESYIEEDFKYEDDESFTCFVMRAKRID